MFYVTALVEKFSGYKCDKMQQTCTNNAQTFKVCATRDKPRLTIFHDFAQSSSRRAGPEVQSALAAKQQAQRTQDITRLQEQLDASQKALDEQKATAQKLEQVKELCLFSPTYCMLTSRMPGRCNQPPVSHHMWILPVKQLYMGCDRWLSPLL